MASYLVAERCWHAAHWAIEEHAWRFEGFAPRCDRQEEPLMLAIHPNARTIPAVRAEIASSSEGSSVLARRYGVSTETIRKWRQRGPTDCRDRSARPHKLP